MATTFHELDVVALREPIHSAGLWEGDEGTIVNVHRKGTSYTVEFMRNEETIAVVEVPATKLRRVWKYTPSLQHDDISDQIAK